MSSDVQIKLDDYGPFQRISLTRRDPRFARVQYQLSAYRIGDTLFDCGGTLTAAALVEVLRERPPRQIWCTHHHEDHTGGVTALRAAFGHMPVFAPRAHVPLMAAVDHVPSYRAHAYGHPIPVRDALAYDAGDTLEVAGHEVAIIESPGHTPGHCSFVLRTSEAAYVLTGDLFTTSPTVAWFESSAPCLLASSRRIAALHERVVMLPTHGRVRDTGREAFEQLIADVDKASERVERAASGLPRTAATHWQLAEQLFGVDLETVARTDGEWSSACFVRSVLDPVLTLPVLPILPPPSAAGHNPN